MRCGIWGELNLPSRYLAGGMGPWFSLNRDFPETLTANSAGIDAETEESGMYFAKAVCFGIDMGEILNQQPRELRMASAAEVAA